MDAGDSLIQALESEYDLEEGFLGKLRSGVFDPAGLERVKSLLTSIHLDDAGDINRRLVALLWFMPTLMTWQIERVGERGGNVQELIRGIDQVQEILSSLLGLP